MLSLEAGRQDGLYLPSFGRENHLSRGGGDGQETDEVQKQACLTLFVEEKSGFQRKQETYLWSLN